MVDPSALSIVMTMLQGRSGYGRQERFAGEGFADVLNVSAHSASFSDVKSEKARFPVGFEPKRGVLPAVLFAVQGDSAAKEADSELFFSDPDMDVVVVIPAGANGREDLLALLAQLLGQEENGDFLCALSSLVEKIMPEGALEEPVTLKDLDDLMQKLFDAQSGQEKQPEVLIPLFALCAFPPAQVFPEEPETGLKESVSPAETAAQDAPSAQWPAETETALTEEAAAALEPALPQPSETPGSQAAQTAEEQPAAPQEKTVLQGTDIPIETVSLQNKDLSAETVLPQETAPAQGTDPPEKTVSSQEPVLPAEVTSPQGTDAPESLSGTAPEWTDDVQSASVQENPEASLPEEEKAQPAVMRYADFGRYRVRLAAELLQSQETEPAADASEASAADAEPGQPVAPSRASAGTEQQEGDLTGSHPEEKSAGAKNEGSTETAVLQQLRQTERPAETAQAPPESPVREAMTKSIIEQITQNSILRQADGGTTLAMELNPKFLGRLSLILTATADGVTAKIHSENDSVRALLSTNLEMLRSSLKDAGINMKNIEITDQNIGWDYTRGQAGGMQWGRESQSRYRFEEQRGAGQAGGLSGGIEGEPVLSSGVFYRTGRIAAPEYDDTVFDYRA